MTIKITICLITLLIISGCTINRDIDLNESSSITLTPTQEPRYEVINSYCTSPGCFKYATHTIVFPPYDSLKCFCDYHYNEFCRGEGTRLLYYDKHYDCEITGCNNEGVNLLLDKSTGNTGWYCDLHFNDLKSKNMVLTD